YFCVFFFFQAEDGIRDKLVTGVQTCALPISSKEEPPGSSRRLGLQAASSTAAPGAGRAGTRQRRSPVRFSVTGSPRSSSSRAVRSEERRVGKECRPLGG